MLYYKLNKEIKLEKLIHDLQKLLNKQQNLESKVLVISIQNIINYAGDSLLPKITYEHNCST